MLSILRNMTSNHLITMKKERITLIMYVLLILIGMIVMIPFSIGRNIVDILFPSMDRRTESNVFLVSNIINIVLFLLSIVSFLKLRDYLKKNKSKEWVAFAKKLPAIENMKLVLFTTYKLATGSMFRKMKAQLKYGSGSLKLQLKSKKSRLIEADIDVLKTYLSN